MEIIIKVIFNHIPETKQHFVFKGNLQASLFAEMLDKNEKVVSWNLFNYDLRDLGWTQKAWIKNINTK